MFLEAKRALNPAFDDRSAFRRPDYSLQYRSARSQITNTSIEDEQENYLQVGGLLYTLVSMKDLPDGTFPGILRELLVLDFPIIVSAEVSIPDQTKILDHFKGRLRRMQAAQRDSSGAFKINVEAQVAQSQLQEVLQAVISSSLKVCNYSMVIAARTSKPIISRADLEEAQRILNDRRQRVVHAVTRMNGARAIPESLAQRRLLIGTLPGMAQDNKRDLSCLTLHGADLLPTETPWNGTPQSPLMLLETPYRQLVPFSPYDPSIGDANMLFMAKSGGGKTFMAQMFLLMMARANPLISIVERGDSYRPLVELMGGRVIEVDLEGAETLNPWDLPPGEIQPTKDKIAFLKNLTRHMIATWDKVTRPCWTTSSPRQSRRCTSASRCGPRTRRQPTSICATNSQPGTTKSGSSTFGNWRNLRQWHCGSGPAKRVSIRSSSIATRPSAPMRIGCSSTSRG